MDQPDKGFDISKIWGKVPHISRIVVVSSPPPVGEKNDPGGASIAPESTGVLSHSKRLSGIDEPSEKNQQSPDRR